LTGWEQPGAGTVSIFADRLRGDLCAFHADRLRVQRMPGEEAASGDFLEVLVRESGNRLGLLANQVGLADGVTLLRRDGGDLLVAPGGGEPFLEGGIVLRFREEGLELFVAHRGRAVEVAGDGLRVR